MVRAYQLTLADTSLHNLYALILAAEGVTQLPQRVDLGDVIFPSPVASITFSLPLIDANSGNTLPIQDQTGQEITVLLAGIPFPLSSMNVNSIYLQNIQVKASAGSMVLDVSVNQI